MQLVQARRAVETVHKVRPFVKRHCYACTKNLHVRSSDQKNFDHKPLLVFLIICTGYISSIDLWNTAHFNEPATIARILNILHQRKPGAVHVTRKLQTILKLCAMRCTWLNTRKLWSWIITVGRARRQNARFLMCKQSAVPISMLCSWHATHSENEHVQKNPK